MCVIYTPDHIAGCENRQAAAELIGYLLLGGRLRHREPPLRADSYPKNRPVFRCKGSGRPLSIKNRVTSL
jgi:hypothetical protein